MIKGQFIAENIILISFAIVLVALFIVLAYHFAAPSLNAKPLLDISQVKVLSLTSNSALISVITPDNFTNPKNITFFINNLTTTLPMTNSTYTKGIIRQQNKYNFTTTINSTIFAALTKTNAHISLISYTKQDGSKVYLSVENFLITPNTTVSGGQFITFYIFPQTRTWDITVNGQGTSKTVSNGQTVYLPNGVYTITGLQTNVSSDLYFTNWLSTSYSGTITLQNKSSQTTELNITNATGAVTLELNYFGNILFTSNVNNKINNDTNITCGVDASRFCIQQSVRNLPYTMYQDAAPYSFNYPAILTKTKTKALAFVDFNTSVSLSCSTGFNLFNPSQTVKSLSFAPCTLQADYEYEYNISVKTSNSSRGNVSIYTPYNNKTITGNNISEFVPKGKSVIITGNANTYYAFSNWTHAGTTITQNPYTFTVVNATNYTANFKISLPTISWEATSNLGGVSTTFSANAIPTNSLIGWSNQTNTATPYTFTFNKTNVFSANTLNTTFGFTWTFAATSSSSGSFVSQNVYCNGDKISNSNSESFNYNWKALNGCQNVTIIANYHVIPPPPPTGGGTGGCSGNNCHVTGTGYLNAAWKNVLISDIYPTAVANNLTTSNLNINNLTVYINNAGKIEMYSNPELNSGNDNFSFYQVSAHSNWGNSFDPVYGNSNGAIFQDIPGDNTTYFYINTKNKFVYNSQNYSINLPESTIQFTYYLKNGTVLKSNKAPPTSTTSLPINITEQEAAILFNQSYPKINKTYIDTISVNASVLFNKIIKSTGTITVYNYPDSIGDISLIPHAVSTNFGYTTVNTSEPYTNITTYYLEGSPTIYSIDINPVKFYYSNYLKNKDYLLTIYDNTTKTYVSGIKNEIISGVTGKTISGLSDKNNYTIIAIYLVPLNITTNLVGQPYSFSTLGWTTVPYNITGGPIFTSFDSSYIKNTSIATQHLFVLPAPSKYINLYSGTTYSLTEGFYNTNNNHFVSSSQTISNNGNYTKCYDSGILDNCLVIGDINGQVSTVTKSGLISTALFSNGTANYDINGPSGNTGISAYTKTFGYTPLVTKQSLQNLNIGPGYDTFFNLSNSYSILPVEPATFNLFYGYAVPIFESYNINITDSPPSTCNNFVTQYQSLYNYLITSKNFYHSCGIIGGTPERVADSQVAGIIIYNTTTQISIAPGTFNTTIPSEPSGVSYGFCNNKVCKTDAYITGFANTKLVNNDGTTNLLYISKSEYILESSTRSISGSSINGYALYENVTT